MTTLVVYNDDSQTEKRTATVTRPDHAPRSRGKPSALLSTPQKDRQKRTASRSLFFPRSRQSEDLGFLVEAQISCVSTWLGLSACGRLWYAAASCVRLRQAATGCGRLRQAAAGCRGCRGCGRLQQAAAGCGRLRQAVGFGGFWDVFGRFCLIFW